ncbi:MAG: hypothetical protein J0M25_13190, partial [Flavobacteriales bacterium]|nr:hypothetical protein [Flavobacteriales bacterium]
MKNKKILFFFLVSCQLLLAQKPTIKKANQLFANKAYVEAAKMYEAFKGKQQKEVLQNLGDCYYYNAQMQFAADNYGNLFFKYKDSIQPEYYFRYAHALKGIEDHERGDKIMGEYLKYSVDTKKFKEHLNNIVPHKYKVNQMTKSSVTGDFGISFFGEKVVFASLRNAKSPLYKWNEKPYLDLYEATVSKDGILEN